MCGGRSPRRVGQDAGARPTQLFWFSRQQVIGHARAPLGRRAQEVGCMFACDHSPGPPNRINVRNASTFGARLWAWSARGGIGNSSRLCRRRLAHSARCGSLGTTASQSAPVMACKGARWLDLSKIQSLRFQTPLTRRHSYHVPSESAHAILVSNTRFMS